ncbi:MAG: cysteine desulfurase-like protein [Phycisphaerae bacterium]|nr:cysteine desulfurase-like protein [Phycisphaerae bacterium]
MQCRRLFPALCREITGRPAVFFDGPGGSQVPQPVIDAVGRYLAEANSNHGGVFATSRASDAMLVEAARAVADFLGTDDPETVIFGANMTTLTLALSRALARTWSAGDEVIVTQLDHDANHTPWVLAAQDAGATVQCVRIHPGDCTLDLDDLAAKLSSRTRLVAVCCASNAVGTMPPVTTIAEMAHAAGAQVVLDAVHYAPHALIDVQAWDCDYLVCSAYKFFGPHVGVLWGKRPLLSELRPYKLRTAPEALPGRWMTGTQNHEGIAGTLAAIEYLADLGRPAVGAGASRRAALAAAFARIGEYERPLTAHLIRGLDQIPGIRIWGITDPARLTERTPTVSITHARYRPIEIARYLAERGFFVWCGNFYALALTEALGLEPDGVTRIGLLHYNTIEEIDRLLATLREL